jgi:hypothetical protein
MYAASNVDTTSPVMPTQIEREILRKRQRSGKLVPLLEELFNEPLEVEDDEDRQFLVELLEKRSKQRHQRGHYSPSQLGSCIRAVYFGRTGVKRTRVIDPRANGFFAQGNFMHLKWQFALWKLHRQGKLRLVWIKGDTSPYGIEVYVANKRGDFSGHIDAIIELDGEIYLVDFKGYQPRLYQQIVGGYVPDSDAIQLTGYMIIVSAGRQYPLKIEKSLLVVESKSGPDERGSPLGLVEVEIQKNQWRDEVNNRLREMREYEAKKETPPPSCHSTRQRQFQTCPWSGLCLEEVREIQEREKAARSDPEGLRVSVPSRRGAANSRKPRRR